MTTIGKGTRVVCVKAGWRNKGDGKNRPGPEIGSRWTVSDCYLGETGTFQGLWIRLAEWPTLAWWLSSKFRPVDQIDDMAEVAARLSVPGKQKIGESA